MNEEYLPVKVGEKTNIFGDGIAFVEKWDFSRGNLSENHRVHHITKVASVCYDSPNSVGKVRLYDRLASEAMGLPSSSFECVPVLLTDENAVQLATAMGGELLDVIKYSEVVKFKGKDCILTNYRALLNTATKLGDVKLAEIFNTEEECDFMSTLGGTFLSKIDLATARQHVRHRTFVQELSRRYVSGTKTAFEFYLSDGMNTERVKGILKQSIDCYFDSLKDGVQPQEARRVLPQSMYTKVWTGYMPSQLENYFNLRLDSHAQQEIRWLAEVMKELQDGRDT